MRLRARLRLHPGPGHATVFELWLRWGAGAAARRARRSRPSLPWLERRLRPSQTSVLIGRAHYEHALRVPVEEHVIFIAPPRKGKSGALAEIIARHPGPAVVTSTRGDLYELTAAARASARAGVRVEPAAAGRGALHHAVGRAGRVRRPGHRDPPRPAAVRDGRVQGRGGGLLGRGDRAVAADAAARRRAAAGHAWTWCTTGRCPGPRTRSWRALPGAGGEAERWGTLIRDLMTSAATKTTDTIRYMVAANLAFMLDPVLREAVTPGPGMFSPAEFVRDGGTLYLIAESRDERPAPVAGLFAALVTEIYHEAALAAAHMPGGRLDPPMLWALDEVTQTCPLPLPSLLADAGGRGIQIMPVVHGAAQLRTRWGRDGARAILDTCGVKVFLPGISDPETLEMASKLSGTMAARERGHEHESRHPVMTEDMISRLPAPPGRHRVRVHPPRRAVPGHRPPPGHLARPLVQAVHPPRPAPLPAARTAGPSCCRQPPPGRTTWQTTWHGMTPCRSRPRQSRRHRRPRPGMPGTATTTASPRPAQRISRPGPGPRGHGTGPGGRHDRA